MPDGQVDLLEWPRVHAAQLKADQAEAVRSAAYWRWHLAPRGEKTNRLHALQAATTEALQANRELTRIIEEARR